MTGNKEFMDTLYRIELKKRKIVQKFLVEIGLTPGQGQARILRYLSHHPHITQKEIADACMLDVTTMSRVLDKLEKLGLIIRERDPDCRRAYQISLTAAGQEKAEQIEQAFQKLADQMCEGISGEKMGLLIGELLKMVENLNHVEMIKMNERK